MGNSQWTFSKLQDLEPLYSPLCPYFTNPIIFSAKSDNSIYSCPLQMSFMNGPLHATVMPILLNVEANHVQSWAKRLRRDYVNAEIKLRQEW